MKSKIERLESRALLTVVVGADGSLLGYTEIPSGEVHLVTKRQMDAGRASGDGAPGFQIAVNFLGGLTASQQAAFATAAARWESIIRGDQPDVGAIDDVLIDASGIAIDGPGNALARANATGKRPAAQHFVPYQGYMEFDIADIATLEASGSLVNTITHEMGHVLGIGTTWTDNGLLSGGGTSSPQFTGASAKAEYAKFLGTFTPANVVVENTGGTGTRDAHWKETTYGNELMTGFLDAGVNPLSRMTAASMIDIGYQQVDLEATDLYTRSNALPTIGTLDATPIATVGSFIDLNLSSATDVSLIQFFRESNGIAGLQRTGTTSHDTIVATISSGIGTTVSTAGLPAGDYTYYAVVIDNFDLQSAYRTASSSLIETIAAPSRPDLADSSDLGFSNFDNLTADNTPTLLGTAAANLLIDVFDGETFLGTTASDESGDWSFTPPACSDGAHTFSARASDGLNVSASSPALTVFIETVAPVLVSSHYDRESTQDVTLNFGEAIANQVTPAKLTLSNTTNNTAVAIATVANAGGNTVASISFTPALLANGRYMLSMPASAVTDAAGNPLAFPLQLAFVQLAGDANNDGTVSFDDLLVLAQNYGTNTRTFSQGNFDYDPSGVVDFSDLLILAQNYGTSLFLEHTSSRRTRRGEAPLI